MPETKSNTKDKNARKNSVKTVKAETKAVAPKVQKAAKADAKKGTQAVAPALNAVLWLVSLILICSAIVGNWYYTNHVVIDESSMGRFLRVAAVIVTIVIGLGVSIFTNKGRQLLTFGREAYVELRKVVWPTRQEAVQTTMIVFVAVCVVSLFLYLCDVVFLQLVRYVTL